MDDLKAKLQRMVDDNYVPGVVPNSDLMHVALSAAALALEAAESCAPGGLCQPNCRGYYDFQLRLRALSANLLPRTP